MSDAYSRWSLRAADWQTTRRMGRWRYAATYGLVWAALTFGLVTGLEAVRGTLEPIGWSWLAVNVVGWTVGGLVFGLATWALNERVYARRTNARDAVENGG